MKKILLFIILSISLITCKDEDPCEGIICQNGGTCANGECVCTEQYEGADCSTQVTPSKIRISKVQITKFPATEDDGGSWDVFPSSSGPDLFPAIFQGSELIWVSTVFKENANPSQAHDFTSASQVDLLPKTAYSIFVYDDDQPDDPEQLGGLDFTITDDMLQGFPETLDIKCTGCTVSFKISVQYIF